MAMDTGMGIDFHTHILPDMDDGAADVDISLRMISELTSQGVHTIVLTPHYYSNRMSLDDFLQQREASVNLLQAHLDQSDVKLIVASETYLTEYLFNNDTIEPLCVGSKKHLLIELPYSSQFSGSSMHLLVRLMSNYNVIPVLAHVERYPYLMKHPSRLRDLIQEGCVLQMNLDSLAIKADSKVLLRLIADQTIHLVGTDCHNLTSRSPQYRKGIDIIENKLGIEYVQKLLDNAHTIINK